MSWYRFGTLFLVSDYPLPELQGEDNMYEGELTLRVCRASKDPLNTFSTGPWLHDWQRPNGETFLTCTSTPVGYVLRFPGLADFSIDLTDRLVECYPASGVTDSILRHLLLDQVLPRVLSGLGGLVLHASASLIPSGGLAFLGESGAGKSTLAASFYQAGYPLLTDDILLLIPQKDQVLCAPTYPGLRLWPDTLNGLNELPDKLRPSNAKSDKQRLILPRREDSPAKTPLVALFVLEEAGASGEPVFVERLPVREAAIALICNSFKLNVTDRDENLTAFYGFARIAARIPAYRLYYRHDFALLPEMRRKVLEMVSSR